MSACTFCNIIAGTEPATIVHRWDGVIAIIPLNPVVNGHLLVLPTTHWTDAAENPTIAAMTMARAAEIAQRPFNIITSAGHEATQSVFHLHLHVIPRTENDGLALPWFSGRKRPSA